MKADHNRTDIAAFDPQRFYHYRDQEKGYQHSQQTSCSRSGKAEQQHLLLHHSFDLRFCHSNGLKQTIITDFSCY